jgi:hypothetical protein
MGSEKFPRSRSKISLLAMKEETDGSSTESMTTIRKLFLGK